MNIRVIRTSYNEERTQETFVWVKRLVIKALLEELTNDVEMVAFLLECAERSNL